MAGLCKSVTRAEIEKADWSLTPGRYVGVSADPEDDEESFQEQLAEITNELDDIAQLSMTLNGRIQATLMGLLT